MVVLFSDSYGEHIRNKLGIIGKITTIIGTKHIGEIFVGHDKTRRYIYRSERLKMSRKGNCTRFDLTVFFSRAFQGGGG